MGKLEKISIDSERRSENRGKSKIEGNALLALGIDAPVDMIYNVNIAHYKFSSAKNYLLSTA